VLREPGPEPFARERRQAAQLLADGVNHGVARRRRPVNLEDRAAASFHPLVVAGRRVDIRDQAFVLERALDQGVKVRRDDRFDDPPPHEPGYPTVHRVDLAGAERAHHVEVRLAGQDVH
jgi:hypothetical protein